jgi:DNA modification methylase
LSDIHLFAGDSLDHYATWPTPTAIVSDGPYGIGGYPGDPRRPEALPDAYEPHVQAWAAKANTQTTLWFWNTEVGWAFTHPVMLRHGWVYRGCNVWDKGVAHIAGNCNGQTMRKFPVVTEICAHYVREPTFNDISGNSLSLQDWLRSEWKRTGMPLNRSNEACGVKNAATRKYLTADHMFYPPPPDVFARLAMYANEHGDPAGRPYFNLSADEMLNRASVEHKWEKLQSKFNFEYGVTNVWQTPANRGAERFKDGSKVMHGNQKPMILMERIIKASTDEGDIIWEPFCGMASASIAAYKLGRTAYTAELSSMFHDMARKRIDSVEMFGI